MTEDNQNPESSPHALPAHATDQQHKQKRDQNNEQQREPSPDLSLWQMIGSAVAAAIGVQSSENRKRDFSRGKAGQFIIIGIVGTMLFVLAMLLLVRLILSVAGS